MAMSSGYDGMFSCCIDNADMLYSLQALGVKIHSIHPSSMHDERAMSTITWLNSARRSAQHVKTVRDHITIRQCHIQVRMDSH